MFPTDNSANSYQNPACVPVYFYNQPQVPTADYYPLQTLPVEQGSFAGNSVVPHYYNSHQPFPDLVTTQPQHFYIQHQHRFHSASIQTATKDDELSLEVSRAYSLLKIFPVQAEKAFRKIYESSYKNVNENVVTGLARAIKDQKDSLRYKEAEEIILSFKGNSIDPAITSGYHNLDNTLARLWQVMGKNDLAEKLCSFAGIKHFRPDIS